MKLVEQVHAWLEEVVQPGDTVIDGTTGNGHDTVWLARLVGLTGRVHAFDLQPEAIKATGLALEEAGLSEVVSLHQRCHTELAKMVLPACRVAVFNLGYLPGGDHTRTTTANTTIVALEAAWSHLMNGGFLSVLAYPGHAAGLAERDAIEEWINHRRDGRLISHHVPVAQRRRPPEWFLLQRLDLTL